jgi:Fe-S-cluster containining protein
VNRPYYGMMEEPPSDVKSDFEEGLVYIHRDAMTMRKKVMELRTQLQAVLEELTATKKLDVDKFVARRKEVKKQENVLLHKSNAVRVEIHPPVDKYTIPKEEYPDIDCEARIPLCKGKCCSMHFHLSKQDLDERVVEWDFMRPYLIRQRKTDGYCVHNDPETRGCGVYHQRPAVCRTYDCREDNRVWIDFEKRIPQTDPLAPRKKLPEPPALPGTPTSET